MPPVSHQSVFIVQVVVTLIMMGVAIGLIFIPIFNSGATDHFAVGTTILTSAYGVWFSHQSSRKNTKNKIISLTPESEEYGIFRQPQHMYSNNTQMRNLNNLGSNTVIGPRSYNFSNSESPNIDVVSNDIGTTILTENSKTGITPSNIVINAQPATLNQVTGRSVLVTTDSSSDDEM